MPRSYRPTTFRVRLLVSLGLTFLGPSVLLAQGAGGGSSLGLRGIGAFGISLGYASVERGAHAFEAGAELDLGHFASRRLRVSANAAFLRSLPYSELVAADDTTYRDIFYDLSGHVTLSVQLRDPTRRVVPYFSGGIGVHALTSSFGSIPIDLRYNTNVFGLRAGAGLRLRTSARGRHAIVIEGNTVLARTVSRQSLRVGAAWLFGDLVQH